jgi:predicted nucleic acid-binding protein
MSRIYWDTMLFVYLLQDNQQYSPRVHALLARSRQRRDKLFTSYLALGEMMAGVEKRGSSQGAQILRDALEEMGFSFLAYGSDAVTPFAKLRAKENLKAPDAIHLACAAAAGIDLFLTGDKQLTRLDVPGIQFIADFNSPIL